MTTTEVPKKGTIIPRGFSPDNSEPAYEVPQLVTAGDFASRVQLAFVPGSDTDYGGSGEPRTKSYFELWWEVTNIHTAPVKLGIIEELSPVEGNRYERTVPPGETINVFPRGYQRAGRNGDTGYGIKVWSDNGSKLILRGHSDEIVYDVTEVP